MPPRTDPSGGPSCGNGTGPGLPTSRADNRCLGGGKNTVTTESFRYISLRSHTVSVFVLASPGEDDFRPWHPQARDQIRTHPGGEDQRPGDQWRTTLAGVTDHRQPDVEGCCLEG